MCFPWFPTVTNRFTRPTCGRITGPCCGVSGASAAITQPMATAAEQTARTFLPERMYTFLVEVTRPKYRSLDAYVPFGCGEAYRGMCGSAPHTCPEAIKVSPQHYDKPPKNPPP